MRVELSRRSVLAAAALTACAPQIAIAPAEPAPTADDPRFAAIEVRVGGRVGVAALDTGSGAWLMHRADERFAMCSMFKWLLAAQMLDLEDVSPGFLDQRVLFNEAYLAPLGHAPVTRANLARGWMSVGEMAEAAVVQSDNGAANALLEGAAMGPEGLTRFLRSNGDAITRLDRTEPGLNENLPGDERDTTMPRAMVLTMQRFLLTDEVLSARSRETLIAWLVKCQTGLQRLRASFPADWRAGDKTGTGGEVHNATTDVAIAWPPGRAPIIIACFLSESKAPPEARNAAHAEVSRLVVESWS